MQVMRDAWFLTKSEYGGLRYKNVISVIMIAYITFMSIPLTHSVLPVDEETSLAYLFIDFYFLTMVPILGFILNKKSFNYHRDDSYTVNLAHTRTMPVSFEVIMTSRIIQLILPLLVNGTIFFTAQYLFAERLFDGMTVPQYISYTSIWLGYAVLTSAVYIFVEMTRSGKTYLAVTVVLMVLNIAAALICWFAKVSILVLTVDIAKQHPLLSPVLMFIAAGCVMFLTVKGIRRKLKTRDLM
ncbi:hypothetical protein [Paenibacillus guangzhouensis]|uniref:hypothetical protein n=1 Tax=Paenibacillus guangzhouensis TaxID=1473112 RepID=UPI00126779DD|nr:hypothetical protein [Paenibacillus guangzhouensis]